MAAGAIWQVHVAADPRALPKTELGTSAESHDTDLETIKTELEKRNKLMPLVVLRPPSRVVQGVLAEGCCCALIECPHELETYLCAYVYIYIYMYVCVDTHIDIYIYIQRLFQIPLHMLHNMRVPKTRRSYRNPQVCGNAYSYTTAPPLPVFVSD